MIEFNGVSDEVANMGILVVVRKNKRTKPKLWKIIGKSNVFKNSFVCSTDDELLHHFNESEIRLANNREIDAKQRMDY